MSRAVPTPASLPPRPRWSKLRPNAATRLEQVKHWSLTSLKEKLVKIGAKIVTHARYVTFQMAEVAVPRLLFAEILHLIRELRPKLPPAPT